MFRLIDQFQFRFGGAFIPSLQSKTKIKLEKFNGTQYTHLDKIKQNSISKL